MARDVSRVFPKEDDRTDPKTAAGAADDELFSDAGTVLEEDRANLDSEDEFFGDIFRADIEDVRIIEELLVGRVDLDRFTHEISAKKGIVTLRWKDSQILRWPGMILFRVKRFLSIRHSPRAPKCGCYCKIPIFRNGKTPQTMVRGRASEQSK